MSDEYVVEIEDAIEVEQGLYLCEVTKMWVHVNEKTGKKSHVISGVVASGPFKGAQFSDFIGIDSDNFSIKQMNNKKITSFMIACADGADDFEKSIRYVENAEGQLVNPAVEGVEIGVYLKQNGQYLNVDRGGYVPASAVDAENDSPF
jgi:hypothetical protein